MLPTLLLAWNLMPTALPSSDGEFAMPYGPKTAIRPLSITAVELKDGFWAPRMETNRKVTIWHEIDECEKTDRIKNFVVAAGSAGQKQEGYIFNDSDVYKVIEAAGYILAKGRDAKLEAKIDAWIDLISAAQEPDGYLCTMVTSGIKAKTGIQRWDEGGGEHELYNVGHMYEAAAAYWYATGKRKLLDISEKNANLICETFREGGRRHAPGHEEIEIGLVRLFDATGNRKYLDQAKWFLDERGNKARKHRFGEYSQDHLPVVEQTTAVGHSVRAAYLYSGMVDVGTHFNDRRYWTASAKIWEDVVRSKTYLTGGIGSSGSNEGFSGEYALPNLSGYAETCATIANIFWNERLFLLFGDAMYVDVLERGLYNAFLSGYGLDGKCFFYPNPLQSVNGAKRAAWFGCACCPPNVARLIASLPQYVYGVDQDAVFVNLYVESEAKAHVGGVDVAITQKTRHPWEGKVEILVSPEKTAEFAIRVRIPGWARNQVFPSDLYSGSEPGAFLLKLNGQAVKGELIHGYFSIQRTWKKGDRVELELPMNPIWVRSNPKVSDNVGRVAVQRGPIVYCAEFADQETKSVLDRVVESGDLLTAKWHDDLGGYMGLTTQSRIAQRTDDGIKVAKTEIPLNLIPYYVWAHRGPGQMAVWLAADPNVAWPAPAKTIAYTSKIATSGGERPAAMADQLEPKTSNDHGVPFFHWWPKKGTTEWVEFRFAEPSEVSSVKVYWFEDEGIGECRLPKAWRVLYREGDAWKPVEGAEYPVAKDRFTEASFKKVRASGIRIEVDLPPRFSTGIHEVVIR